jgi:hypothetical protein
MKSIAVGSSEPQITEEMPIIDIRQSHATSDMFVQQIIYTDSVTKAIEAFSDLNKLIENKYESTMSPQLSETEISHSRA